MPAEPAAFEIDVRWLVTLAAATSIIGIRRRSAKGDHAASTRRAAPAIIRSKTSPPPESPSVVLVIAADARLTIEMITNLASTIAISTSTSRRAHRLLRGQVIATNATGGEKRVDY